MNAAMILGTIGASVWLAAVGTTPAVGAEDLLIGGQTTYDGIQYDPTANLLTIAGGRGDDRIEVVLAPDGGMSVNGVSLAKLGIRLKGVPVVAILGGGGNDILISRGLPLTAISGGDGKDVLVWDNGDGAFDHTTYGEDIVVWNSSETQIAYGGAGLDILIGNTGGDRDAIYGNLGRDILVGGSGVDAADDEIVGGWGSDWIVGGTGRD